MSFGKTVIIRVIGSFICLCLVSYALFYIHKRITDLSDLPNKSEIVALSIDAALNEGRESAYNNFWVDYSKAEFLDEKSRRDCTASRTFLSEINSDSLFAVDTIWKKEHGLRQGLFVIESVTRLRNTIKVNLSLTYGVLAAKGYEIVLTKDGTHYKVTKQYVTWVS
jgi:hypothetical protein